VLEQTSQRPHTPAHDLKKFSTIYSQFLHWEWGSGYKETPRPTQSLGN